MSERKFASNPLAIAGKEFELLAHASNNGLSPPAHPGNGTLKRGEANGPMHARRLEALAATGRSREGARYATGRIVNVIKESGLRGRARDSRLA